MPNAAARPAAPRPPSLLPRRIAGIALGLLLYSSATDFTPVSWFIQSDWTTALDGPSIIDRVLTPIILIGAALLHWYIASAVAPLPLTLTVPDPNGDFGPQQQVPTRTLVLGLWLPEYFWGWVALEGALLWGLRFSDYVVGELARRSLLVGILVGVWVLGWNAMPWYRKEQAWGLMKDYVVRLVLMEMAEMAFGGGRRRGRRRRM